MRLNQERRWSRRRIAETASLGYRLAKALQRCRRADAAHHEGRERRLECRWDDDDEWQIVGFTTTEPDGTRFVEGLDWGNRFDAVTEHWALADLWAEQIVGTTLGAGGATWSVRGAYGVACGERSNCFLFLMATDERHRLPLSATAMDLAITGALDEALAGEHELAYGGRVLTGHALPSESVHNAELLLGL